jgi:hypothetical protein
MAFRVEMANIDSPINIISIIGRLLSTAKKQPPKTVETIDDAIITSREALSSEKKRRRGRILYGTIIYYK